MKNINKIKTIFNNVFSTKNIFGVSIVLLIFAFLCSSFIPNLEFNYVKISITFDELTPTETYNPIGYIVGMYRNLFFIGHPTDYSLYYGSDKILSYFFNLLLILFAIRIVFFKKRDFFVTFAINFSLFFSKSIILLFGTNNISYRPSFLNAFILLINLLFAIFYFAIFVKDIKENDDPIKSNKKSIRNVLVFIIISIPVAVITFFENISEMFGIYFIKENTPSLEIKFHNLLSTPFFYRCPSTLAIFLFVMLIYFVFLMIYKKNLKKYYYEG